MHQGLRGEGESPGTSRTADPSSGTSERLWSLVVIGWAFCHTPHSHAAIHGGNQQEPDHAHRGNLKPTELGPTKSRSAGRSKLKPAAKPQKGMLVRRNNHGKSPRSAGEVNADLLAFRG
jgi:hypothetical protein